MIITTAPRGTKDVLPGESWRWQRAEGVCRSVAARFGFLETRFPTFEHTELFIRSVGDTTDVVQKEMYTWNDRAGRSISLRPEGTASVVRSFVEHSVLEGGLPVKAYYIAPNFRYEKPQAGRLREHHQFGVECFGSANPAADAEVIGLGHCFLTELGVRGLSLEVNSIGCPSCRPAYQEALRDHFGAHAGSLCPTCTDRLDRNPMRILDCKSEVCGAIAKNAPITLDYLCPDCEEHLHSLFASLSEMGVGYTVNSGIVRGLDYYTRTVFEFKAETSLGSLVVLGGGRYDGLVEAVGGRATPGVGFGSGLERVLLVLEDQDAWKGAEPGGPDIFIASLGSEAALFAGRLTHGLRLAGASAERDIMGRALKAQMKYADKINAKYSCVIGDDEVRNKTAAIKNMATGESFPCPLTIEKMIGFLKG